MDRSDILQLVDVTYTTDDIGQKVETETTRDVFCNIQSVGQNEWFEAGRAGLKAELKATMFAPDYNGETACIVNNVRYGIYRTYRASGENLELYLERKAGA